RGSAALVAPAEGPLGRGREDAPRDARHGDAPWPARPGALRAPLRVRTPCVGAHTSPAGEPPPRRRVPLREGEGEQGAGGSHRGRLRALAAPVPSVAARRR